MRYAADVVSIVVCREGVDNIFCILAMYSLIVALAVLYLQLLIYARVKMVTG